MTTQSFGRYVVTERLGRGGMAEVYAAHDPVLERRVAVKVIHPHLATDGDFEERFRQEARLVASLRHPHIVRLYDFGVVNDQPFMVMEYLDGGTLKDVLAQLRARDEKMPLKRVAGLLQDLASALDYAHAQGAIHRDIKPANILFSQQTDPVLTDFGIAKILSDTTQVSLTGAIVGTPSYMSPEQAAAGPVDARSDLYSLGVVLYEMVTGRVPFQGDSPTTVLLQHLSAPPPPPRQLNPELPEVVQAVILKALAKDPAQRFDSAGELAAAFAAAIEGKLLATDITSDEDPTLVAEDELTVPATQLEFSTTPAQPVSEVAAAEAAAPQVEQPVVPTPDPRLQAASLRSKLMRFGHDLPLLLLGAFCLMLAVAHLGLQVWQDGSTPFTSWARAFPYLILFFLAGAVAVALHLLVRSQSSLYRRQAIVSLGLSVLVGVGWGSWTTYDALRVPEGFVIAIGDFDGSEATRRIDFARRIYDQLTRELADLGDMAEIARTFEVYRDSTQARAGGARRNAMLVIWGWYDDAGVSPRVEALQLPPLQREAVSLLSLIKTAQAAPDALEGPAEPTLRDLARFVRTPTVMPDVDLFARDGPQQMAYVSAAILGMGLQVQGDAARALAMFDKALAHARTAEGDFLGLEVVYFQRATVLFQQGKISEAIADLEQAVTIKPDLYEAHFNLAIAYAETCTPARQLDAAIASAQTAVRLRPQEAAAHRLLGDLMQQAGRPAEALAALETARELEPNNPETFELLASVHASLGNEKAAQDASIIAVALRESAVVQQPRDLVRAHLALGDAYIAAGEYGKALSEYQKAQALAPDLPAVDRGLGLAYYWQNQLDLAEEQFSLWVQRAPKNPLAHLVIGLLLAEQNRTTEAIAALQESIALAPCNVPAHQVLAGLYWQKGDYAAAAAGYRTAASIDPTDPDTFYLLGVTEYLLGAYDAAIEALEESIKLRDDFAPAYFALGKIDFDLGRFERAAGSWEAVVFSLAPDTAEYYVALAHAYEKLDRWNDAVMVYQDAIELEANADWHAFLGLAYQRLGDPEAAVVEYQRAIELERHHLLAHWALGDLYFAQGQLDEAAVAYRRVIEIAADPNAYVQLALIQQQKGDVSAAISLYQEAITVGAQNPAAHLQLANLYAQTWQLDEAEATFRNTLNLNPESPEAHAGLAMIEYKRCNASGMEKELQAAIELAPDRSLYLGLLAAALQAQGRNAQAAAVYQQLAQQPTSDALAHIMAGEYLLRETRFVEAAEAFQLASEPASGIPFLTAAAHDGLGRTYYMQDRLAAARDEFELALQIMGAHAAAQAALGDIFLREGQIDQALDAYAQALALLPAYSMQLSADNAPLLEVTIHVRRGIALARTGQDDEAQAAFQEALQQGEALLAKAPGWAQVHFTLGFVHTVLEQADEADAAFAAASECDQSLAVARGQIEEYVAKLQGELPLPESEG